MSENELIMNVFLAGGIFACLFGLSKTESGWLQAFLGFMLISGIVGIVLVWTG